MHRADRRYSLAAAALFMALASACDRQSGAPEGRPGATPGPKPASALSIEDQGRRAFKECAVCHAVQDPTTGTPMRLVGPNLYGVYGRAAGQAPGYAYSPALQALDIVWDEATLDAFLLAPMTYAPGNRMSYAGQPDAEKRAALIAYLRTLR